MNTNSLTSTLDSLADLLEYPGNDFPARLARTGASSKRLNDAPLPPLLRFVSAISPLTPDQREELYTGTFDVTPSCVPYLSIHLFGEENFKRGEFMAGLHARYQQAGFSPAGELPDHLSVLLRFAARTGEAERRELVKFCLLGPIGKMIAAMNEANPYQALLEAVHEALQAAYPGLQPALSPVEQMRQHGAGCATVTAGCSCGSAGIQNGPDDDLDPTGIPAPTESGGSRISTLSHL